MFDNLIMFKILIIEDDEIISNSLSQELNSWNYKTKIVKNYNFILSEFEEFKPSLVLLDIVLPNNNGYFICQKIREFSKVPIIFISSKKEKIDQLMGLQYGGDDYIEKPIDLNLTIAKIGAILRRTYDYCDDINYLIFNEIFFYKDKNILKYKTQEINLSKTENNILAFLFKNKTNISDKNLLMEFLWKDANFIDDNTLAVNINRLRQKLSNIGLKDLILTKKNSGYYLNKEIGL